MKVKMNITNADLKIGGVKINSISASSIVVFGDAESFHPRSVSVTRGVQSPRLTPIASGGPVGAIR